MKRPILKRCARCGSDKQLHAFRPDLRYRLGVTGWCRRCRRDHEVELRHNRNGIRFRPDETQTCGRCHKVKGLADFPRDPHKANGRGARCKQCRKEVEGPLRSREYQRRNHLWYFYGITADDLAALLAEQGGGCKICGRALTKPLIDHCHESGAVRGLLCNTCNNRLKGVEDREFLQKAQAYLARAATVTPQFFKRRSRAFVDGEACAEHVGD